MATKEKILEAPEGEYFTGPQVEPTDDFGFAEPVVRAPIEDPTMDPSNAKWSPKKYFDAQNQVIIVLNRTESDILSDPTGKKIVTQPVSINGYTLHIKKGVPTKVPEHFADYLVEIGAAVRYAEIQSA